MAREIIKTLILEGELVAETPLHIGGADTGHTTDMALAVDGCGRYYLPGTSLAGAPVVNVSAQTGSGIEALRQLLFDAAQGQPQAAAAGAAQAPGPRGGDRVRSGDEARVFDARLTSTGGSRRRACGSDLRRPC